MYLVLELNLPSSVVSLSPFAGFPFGEPFSLSEIVAFRLDLYEDVELSKYRDDVGEDGSNVVLIDVVRI